jgi:CHAT domain-containing protein/Tfp pilus assembly protein PilF
MRVASSARPDLSLRSPRPAIAAFVLLCFARTLVAAQSTPSESTPTNAVQEKSAAVRLQLNKPIQNSLAGGQTRTYEVELVRGQFMHALVMQQGVDVAVKLFAPDNNLLIAMDSPNDTTGPEPVSCIAEISGLYRIEVTPGNPSSPAGRYEIKITDIRSPTDGDRTRIMAEQKLAEAAQLMGNDSEDGRKASARRFEDLAILWHSLTDGYEEALSLNAAGNVYSTLGDSRKALQLFGQAVIYWSAEGYQQETAAALANMGRVSDDLGEREKGLAFLTQALSIEQQSGAKDTILEATTLNDTGRVYNHLGEKQKALEFYNKALDLARKLGVRGQEAMTLNNVGAVYHDLGQTQRALEFYTQSLELDREIGNRFGESVALHNVASLYDDLGEKQRALDDYGKALSLDEAIGNRFGIAMALDNIGILYMGLGDKEKSVKSLRQALALHRAMGDRAGEARTLSDLGTISFNSDELPEARALYEQALAIHRTVGDRLGEARVLGNIGNVFVRMNEFAKALTYFEEALPISRAVSDRAGEASILTNIGIVYANLGEKQQAEENYGQALALAREVHDPLRETAVLVDLMAFWRHEGQLTTAVFFGKQAVNRIQQVRGNISGLEKDVRQTFLKSKEKTYRDLADLLIKQGRLPEAQQVLDLLKDEEYFEFIRRDEKNAASLTASVKLTESEEALSREYEENATRVTAAGNEWAALHSKPLKTPEEEKRLGVLSDQLKRANEAWDKFLSGLSIERGKSKEAQEYVENLQESASGMQRVLHQLGPGVVALYTLVSDERYSVIIVTPTVMVAREYPIKAEDLRKKVFQFRQALVDPKSDPIPMAQELYRILVGPAEQDLAGAKAKILMWSLDDILRYVPMVALNDGHEYLVEKFQNEVFTPASVASLTEHPNVNGWRGLGLGVSKSYGDFSALPSVPEELHRIIRDSNVPGASGVLPGKIMLDETFTEVGMKSALEHTYPLVHIASHFAFAPGNDTNSFLLLGGNDPQGEHLSLAEIRKDPGFTFAGTELLTLSACDTALGAAEGDGREVDGLGILAQRKGARAVVATLWAVNDQSTGLLMQEFYRRWTSTSGMPKVEALREAQLTLLRSALKPASPKVQKTLNTTAYEDQTADARGVQPKLKTTHSSFAHPYYWAPFILIGNWR